MFKIVENIDITVCSFGGNNFLILRHESRFVHFTLVINLYVDRNSWLLIFGDATPSYAISVIINSIFLVVSCVF